MTHPDPDVLLDMALKVLPAVELAPVRAHLDECAACSERFALLEEEQAVLGQVLAASPAPPDGLERAVRSALRRDGGSWWLRGIALAAAASLLVGGALVLQQPPPTTRQVMLHQLRVSEFKALGLGGGR